MNQCVPSWDLDDSPNPPIIPLQTQSNSLAPNVPSLDYEVAELTWENGQLAMHGLGPPRVRNKPISSYGGTLESIVNQATQCIPPHHHGKSVVDGNKHDGDEVVPWFNNHHAVAYAPPIPGLVTFTKDALVPCSRNTSNSDHHRSVHLPGLDGSAHMGSCSGATNSRDWMMAPRMRVGATQQHEWSNRADMSVSGSATCGGDSYQLTVDTFDRELGTTMFTSTSMGSPENTSSDKQCTNRTGDDHDSVCHSRAQREAGDEEDIDNDKKRSKNSSPSTKRKRAAAIHNQSERKRRDKINQRMKTLQKLVPNSSKTDKASMLDEVIEYLKQLQAQVHMMSRMNMSPAMMLPLAMLQQLQMSMMGMGMGMGMGVAGVLDINRPNIAGLPPFLHPTAAFMQPMTSWDTSSATAAPGAAGGVMPDPLAALLACQSQPITLDAYSRMAALYQQFQQPPAGSGPKN
ncbi:hypothetical protein K7X08_008065 [Anisodus acutangulus]|uniref:BHLH domain-containing protein n=1 Tax=Anisodus acutangulus TaxID=402998 RepID=A0A9Q1RNH5_9SOLA|nr:hypothetical protein K7X08_008065 [Anisodus acutangulus]